MNIDDGVFVQGHLPNRVKLLVLEWRLLYLAEIKAAWQAATSLEKVTKIPPLEN